MLLPCIYFNDNCDEAISYYKETLGATVKSIAYAKDAPADAGMDDCPANFIMHSEVEIFGVTFALSDGGETSLISDNYSFMLLLDTDEEVKNVWSKLAADGKIINSLEPQFWASLSGYVQDKFGVGWSVNTRA